MTVRSEQLALLSVDVHSSYVTIYTCPAGRTTIVKSVYMAPTPGATVVAARIQAGPESAPFFAHEPAGAADLGRWEGWVVMNPGDELQVYSDEPGVNFTPVIASGAELVG